VHKTVTIKIWMESKESQGIPEKTLLRIFGVEKAGKKWKGCKRNFKKNISHKWKEISKWNIVQKIGFVKREMYESSEFSI
jgi:hypothetical protein